MKGNNSSGQLKFFHNISIEKQDKLQQQQQPKPIHTTTNTRALTQTQNEEMQQVNCCSKQALIIVNQYNGYFVLSTVLLSQFVFLYLFNFFVESVKTHTQPHRDASSHSLTLTYTCKPNQQNLMKVVSIQRNNNRM